MFYSFIASLRDRVVTLTAATFSPNWSPIPSSVTFKKQRAADSLLRSLSQTTRTPYSAPECSLFLTQVTWKISLTCDSSADGELRNLQEKSNVSHIL